MDHHQMHHGHGGAGEMMRRPPQSAHEAALRAVQKPPAKPWRAGGGSLPPKVYRVEPREFRDLVQRLTGAPPNQRPHVVAPTQPVAVRPRGGEEMYAAAPWCSFPLLGPTSVDAHHGM